MQEFKTESKKLLDLMINSIYTNKEIFLRELISNSSDAVDKLYFKSLTDQSIEIEQGDLEIRVSFDKGQRILTVSDDGIGMTKEELDRNLGTIAHSDSLEFKAENSDDQGGDVDIIGQFGVGFYSAFMVADQVTVVSRSYESEEAYEWKSDGVEGYTIEPAERFNHGTDVILTLKQDTEDEEYTRFLDQYTLEDLIKRYSNYVRYPIKMNMKRMHEVPRPSYAGDDYEPRYEEFTVNETINSMIPIWKRNKSEVSDEEYNEFYKSDFHDYADPIRRIDIHAEGTLTYDALLFIPSRPAYDMYTSGYEKGLALYSSNVLIMEKCADLVPDYFNFVRGVVDSQDLTLNISRETLQQNSQLRAIGRRVEKKIKAELADMRDNDRETYVEFWKDFGRSLKFGIYASYGEKRDVLGDLLMFYSAKEQKFITIDEYIDAMPEDQEDVFYAAGNDLGRVSKMPVVTTVLGRGYDVLLCTENIDEFCLQSLHEYREKLLKNVASGDLGLETEAEKAAAEATAKDHEALFNAMAAVLGDRVSKVTVSTRLSDAPACLTTAGPISLEMERVLSASPDTEKIKSERVLEINPKHDVFEALAVAQDTGDTEKVELYTNILYDQAVLIEGMQIDDPIAFAANIAKLMK